MIDRRIQNDEITAVDDVRFVREKIASESGGDLLDHIKETGRIVGSLREKLSVRSIPVERKPAPRDATVG
jgi:hypothetical protein